MLSSRSSSQTTCSISTSTLAFNQNFTSTGPGILLMAQVVCGMLVWILLAGTDYTDVPGLSWVMFVSVVSWILSTSIFIVCIIGAHGRFPQFPWITLNLIFNTCSALLYLSSAVVLALYASQAARGRHNYKCWTAATCFSFLTTLAYVTSLSLSYCAWKNKDDDQ